MRASWTGMLLHEGRVGLPGGFDALPLLGGRSRGCCPGLWLGLELAEGTDGRLGLPLLMIASRHPVALPSLAIEGPGLAAPVVRGLDDLARCR
eukprot:5261539-Heterocapsa_arctica.AAC.1